jgi:hypothetical protein
MAGLAKPSSASRIPSLTELLDGWVNSGGQITCSQPELLIFGELIAHLAGIP